MMARNFSISDFTKVKVFTTSELCYNISILKRVGLKSAQKNIVFTLKEWKTLAAQLPSLVNSALAVHHDLLRGKTATLHESRHIISSRFLSLLSCSASRNGGGELVGVTPSIICNLCPYQTRDSVDVTIPSRGVALSFDELMALSECAATINKYIACHMSTSKLITLREPADVLYLQSFCQSFYDEPNARRVRIVLEKVEEEEEEEETSSSSSAGDDTKKSPPASMMMADRDEVDNGDNGATGGSVDGGGGGEGGEGGESTTNVDNDDDSYRIVWMPPTTLKGEKPTGEDTIILSSPDPKEEEEAKEEEEKKEEEEEEKEEEEVEVSVQLHNPDGRYVSEPLFKRKSL